MADDLVLSLLMLAALGLLVGAILLWRRQGFVRQVWLMLIAAAVMLANVVIWVIPTGGSGDTPAAASATN
jgi:hypothetical protein